jgi:hypothetical protein
VHFDAFKELLLDVAVSLTTELVEIRVNEFLTSSDKTEQEMSLLHRLERISGMCLDTLTKTEFLNVIKPRTYSDDDH